MRESLLRIGGASRNSTVILGKPDRCCKPGITGQMGQGSWFINYESELKKSEKE